MTEVELVAVALATGAAPGRTDSARGAVHDLYTGLKEAIRRRLSGAGAKSEDGGTGGSGYGVRVLDAFESDPDVWWTRLLQVLAGSGVAADQEVLAAARAVLRAERRTGHAVLDTRVTQGALVGDGTTRPDGSDR
ncbi:hypothetical protein [Streptomyces sp. NPDC050704]|uniref:hypothetical protein n=1 Tax=Streptomyces sp. NPDC050704 TaxID=3157219 RepID=UPI00343547E1